MLQDNQTFRTCVTRAPVLKSINWDQKLAKHLNMPEHSGTGQHQSAFPPDSLDLPRAICSGDTANSAQSLPPS